MWRNIRSVSQLHILPRNLVTSLINAKTHSYTIYFESVLYARVWISSCILLLNKYNIIFMTFSTMYDFISSSSSCYNIRLYNLQTKHHLNGFLTLDEHVEKLKNSIYLFISLFYEVLWCVWNSFDKNYN